MSHKIDLRNNQNTIRQESQSRKTRITEQEDKNHKTGRQESQSRKKAHADKVRPRKEPCPLAPYSRYPVRER